LSVDEIMQTWNAPSSVAMLASVHFAPSESVLCDATQILLDRYNGTLFLWDSRDVLTSTGHRPAAQNWPRNHETGAT
jgi:hypothetical protein